MKDILAFIFLFSITNIILCQNFNTTKYGRSYKFESSHTSFPDKNRENGYNYKNQLYSMEDHYNDSTVLVFIPSYFVPKDSIDLVFYFHGWNNNIDSTVIQFNLFEQFYKSKKNAILVLAEGAKNAPDSYGGKLEEKGTFKDITNDVIAELTSVFNKKFKVGKISLAGHSGAYRVMSFILMQGGITEKINAVYLFDALYADVEKYTYWIDHYNGKFINIFTQEGGTKSESENLMVCLEGWKIPFEFIEDDDFSSDELKESRIIIIKSDMEHNDVIHTKNQFQKFLNSSY